MVKMLQNDLYKISRGKLKCEKMSHFDEENWKERGKPEQWARKLRWSASSGFALFATENTRSTPKMRFLVKSLTKQLSKGNKCFTWGRLDHNGGGKMSVEKVLKQNNWIILPRLLILGGQSLWARMEGLCSRGTRGINSGEATHSDLLQSWFYYVAYCYSIQYTYLVIKLKNVRSGTCLDYPKNTVYSLPGVCL